MKERLDEFKKKLADLMDEYEVEITASDEYSGYPECGEDIQIVISTEDKYVDGEFIHFRYEEQKFGQYIDSERLRE